MINDNLLTFLILFTLVLIIVFQISKETFSNSSITSNGSVITVVPPTGFLEIVYNLSDGISSATSHAIANITQKFVFVFPDIL